MEIEENLMTKIMVVDDEPDLREMINLMMQKEGFETVTCESGDDLIQKIDGFTPDLITLDVMMPGLTTREILEKLKEKHSAAKIILLTVVRFSDEEKKHIVQLGNVVDYVSKPFEFDDLMKVVHENLS